MTPIWLSVFLIWAAEIATLPGPVPGAPESPTLTAPKTLAEAGVRSEQSEEEDEDDGLSEEEKRQEDEAKLTREISQHMERITLAGQAYYDGKNLKLRYTDPAKFFEDVEFYGRNDPRHTEFRPEHLGRVGEPDPQNQRNVFRCFGANTQGSFLLRPRFKGKIEVTAQVQFQLAEKKAFMFLMAHSNQKSYVANNLGVHLVHKREKKRTPKVYPHPSRTYSQDPRKWLDRTNRKSVKLEFDPETGKLDTGSHELVIEEPPKGGQVGFAWKGVKFAVTRLEIEGELDREWAKTAILEPRRYKE